MRWSPKPEKVTPEFRATFISNTAQNGNSESNQQSSPNPGAQTALAGIIWAQQGAYVRPIKVRLGLSDGTKTEVQGDELKEGLQIIVGEQQQQQVVSDGTTNPFTPKLPSRSGRPSGGQRPQ